MNAGLWLYDEQNAPFAGLDHPERHVETAIRMLLLACELNHKAALSMPAERDIHDERIEAMRWRGHPMFVSPALRRTLEETANREREGA